MKHGNLNAVLKHKDTNKSQKHFMNSNDGLSTKDSSKWFDEMNTQEFSLEERLDNRKNLTKCQLVVSQRSKNNFKERVLYEDANSLLLKLRFSAIIKVRGSTDTILPIKWRWVFRDTLQYLHMPYAANVWSLGLLGIHNGKPIDIELGFSTGA